jgi:uncharacterized membrane protein
MLKLREWTLVMKMKNQSNHQNNSTLQKKRLISIVLLISAISLTISGFMNLYFHDETSSHIILGILFSVFSIWHIKLNWVFITMYFKGIPMAFFQLGIIERILTTFCIIVILFLIFYPIVQMIRNSVSF